MDQEYKYDFMGRLKETKSGMVESNFNGTVRAYSQTIGYDVFGDMTSRSSDVWGENNNFSATYTNGRKPYHDYDASGNIVEKPTVSPNIYDRWEFDASGRMLEQESKWFRGGQLQASFYITNTIANSYSGDGQLVKRHNTKLTEQTYPTNVSSTIEETEYYVMSSVLGGKRLTTLNDTGGKISTKVYGGSGEIAEQRTAYSAVVWRHADAVTGSFNTTTQAGYLYQENEAEFNAEFEPLGAILPTEDPVDDPDIAPLPPNIKFGGNPYQPEKQCTFVFAPMDCSQVRQIISSHAAILGGAVISFELHVTGSRSREICDENSPPDCVDSDYDEPSPVTTYDVNITPILSKDFEPLSKEQNSLAISALSELKDYLRVSEIQDGQFLPQRPSDDCQKNVLDKLASIGFSTEKFLNYLSNGANYFNGEKSEVNLTTAFSNQMGGNIPKSLTTAKFFKLPSAPDALTSSNLSVTKLTVFFKKNAFTSNSSYNKALIFHEALHGFGSFLNGGQFGKFGDNELKTLFGLSGKGSTMITDFIKLNCTDLITDYGEIL